MTRQRYLVALVATLIAGLVSRSLFDGVPVLGAELGDGLYAVAAYLVLRVLKPDVPVGLTAAATFAIVVGIELFQLTGIPADLADRESGGKLFALVLGRGFRWLDLVALTVGVSVTWTVDREFAR